MKTITIPTLGILIIQCFPSTSLGVGWDKDDYIVSSFSQGIAVFDHDWSFKGYVDEKIPAEPGRAASGLDFDATGNLVSAWGGSGLNDEVRKYGQLNGSLIDRFNLVAGYGVVIDLKVGPSGNIFAANTQDSIREYTPKGQEVRVFSGPGRFSQGSSALAVLPSGEVLASPVSASRDSVAYVLDQTGSHTGEPVRISQTNLEGLEEPVDLNITPIPTNYFYALSLRYLSDSDTILGIGNVFRNSFGVLEVWEISAKHQTIKIEDHPRLGSEINYHLFVNRFASPFPRGDAHGVTKGVGGEVFATLFDGQILHWANDGAYLGFFEPVVGNGEPIIAPINILWAGNSPQFAVPEPESLTLMLLILLGTTVASRYARAPVADNRS